MASGFTSPLGIIAIILIILGVIAAIIGLILLVASQNKPKQWYMWLLLIGGVILGLIGTIMLIFILAHHKEPPKPTSTEVNIYKPE